MLRRRRYTLFLFALLMAAPLMAQIPSGYYDAANGKTGDALKEALHDIIKGHTTVSYNNLWNAFWSTDNKGNGIVWDMYSDVPGGTPPYTFEMGQNQCGIYTTEGDCYNREHSWPQSWFNEQTTPRTDLHHIFPTDGFVNQKRDNYPYGEVQSASWTSRNGSKLGPCKTSLGYTGTVFEPIDAYKGDFARALMYMSVRYYSEDGSWNTSAMTNKSEILPWAIAMLMEWNEQDPVSQKEIDRNNAIYADYQHNRNPFIDHPEYARMIWDENWSGGGDDPGGDDPAEGDYVKVTENLTDWSGAYLIVYENGSLAFDGGLTTLDATGNTISVTIENNTIAATETVDAAMFTIAAVEGGYSIRSASGYYIGQTTDDNGLKTSQTMAYANTVSFNDNDIDIVGAVGAHLRFNNASNQSRFRYYKSSTYTNQQPIQLYKKTTPTATQSVTLSAGWNWWAPTVEADLDGLFDAVQVVGHDDAAPTHVAPGEMYKVWAETALQLTLSGTPAANVSVAILPGVSNWFGCPATEPLSLTALGISPATGDKIISQDGGFAIYNGSTWSGTLTSLQPGEGYVYYSADTVQKTLEF